ncbi:hypothetical protein Franean1_4914 [Parafrankia sp. EAN1pec]|nr:hypothetical protein Franean1_4914 [Frankia sp. EAN1pec]
MRRLFVIPTEHPLSLTESTAQPSHPLRRLRALHGWSYEAVARIVAVRARELGVASMAAQRQKIWRWENRGVTPDRISQLALARELGVPDDEITAHPWPEWLPELGAPSCAQQIATLRGILERVRDVLRAGDSATASALVEQGLTVPVDEMVLGTVQMRGAAVRTAMVRGARRSGPTHPADQRPAPANAGRPEPAERIRNERLPRERLPNERLPGEPVPHERFPAGQCPPGPGPAERRPASWASPGSWNPGERYPARRPASRGPVASARPPGEGTGINEC